MCHFWGHLSLFKCHYPAKFPTDLSLRGWWCWPFVYLFGIEFRRWRTCSKQGFTQPKLIVPPMIECLFAFVFLNIFFFSYTNEQKGSIQFVGRTNNNKIYIGTFDDMMARVCIFTQNHSNSVIVHQYHICI